MYRFQTRSKNNEDYEAIVWLGKSQDDIEI